MDNSFLNINMRLANERDKEEIYHLYKQQIGKEFCTWNDYYPEMSEINHDIETKNLFVFLFEKKIIGAVSVCSENELDDATIWTLPCKNPRELTRVVVDDSFKGRGFAAYMVTEVEKSLANKGVDAVHLLAAIKNIPAVKTYQKLGYVMACRAFLYDIDFYCFERRIK